MQPFCFSCDPGLPAQGIPPSEPVESWAGLLRNRYRWVLTLVLALPILQQLSGINTVVFYSSLVFASAGIRNPIAATVLVGAVNLACTFVASALMDAKGRKTLLLLSHGGMAGCLVVMLGTSLLASLLHGTAHEQHAVLPGNLCCSHLLYTGAAWLTTTTTLVAVLAYIAFFALGVGPIPWLYIGEVLPDNIKVLLPCLTLCCTGTLLCA